MTEDRQVWRVWARTLQAWGLKSFAAWLLEATRPLHVVGAQLVYVGQPLLGVFFSHDHVRSLAEILEQPEETKALVLYLQEDAIP